MSTVVDVIIPVRDVVHHLPEAIESVLAQREHALRVTVVDAGSIEAVRVDGATARVIRSDRPLTAGAARNLGVERTDEEWVAFLDADDRWTPGALPALVSAAEASGADAAVGTVRHFASASDAGRLRVPDGTPPALMAGGVVFRRSLWTRIGGFDPDLRTGEFVEWFNRVRSAGTLVAQIDDVVLERRVHSESTTARLIGDRDDYLKVVRRWMNRND